MRRAIALSALGLLAVSAAAEGATKETVLAWYRVTADTPHAQAYNEVPYVWTGAATIHLAIDTPPAPGHILELEWGSKNDARSAVATINGKEVQVRGGGYDGFKPLRVAIPDGVTGNRYEIRLSAGPGKAGFISAARLVATGTSAEAPKADPKATAHKITLKTDGPVTPPAPVVFPEMRRLWDREPPPPIKPQADAAREAAFRQAERNARQAAESLYRCRRFVDGWLAQADPETGLIPRNLSRNKDIWNAKDSAADNYPFMVLSCAITDRPLFEGRMLEMLRTETRLTSRLGPLPDTYSFTKKGFASAEPNLGSILFGSSEYVKDGLLPLTEWLGPSPWCDRMLSILDAIWKRAPVDTPHGKIVSTSQEVNGEMLQALSRVTWMTGDRKYLDWAIRMGDYYLLGTNHPTRDSKQLRLRDHGCEIVSGLCELYAACHFAAPEKKKAYAEPIHAMCDRILEIARDPRGMMYSSVDPVAGTHSRGICDTWGYNYNGIYTVYLVDKTPAYRDAVRHVLSNLKEHVTAYNWGSADEFADSIEGAINLTNREPVASAADWIDSEIKDMWSKQRADGVVEGWHGDGNSARTAIMYVLWKTQGATIRPWRKDVRFGAVRHGDAVCISLAADEPWTGRLLFDVPRHKVHMKMPLDWPRINQFPEWFTVEEAASYTVEDLAAASKKTVAGKQMREGVTVTLEPGKEVRLVVQQN